MKNGIEIYPREQKPEILNLGHTLISLISRLVDLVNILGLDILIILSILGVSIWDYRILSNYQFDDPYIIFRYVRNIATGTGFVFNPGEHILGVTSPLYTLILTLIYFFTHNLPFVSILISFLSRVFLALVIYFILRKYNDRLSGFLSAMIILTHPAFYWGQGLETNIYLLLVLLGFYLYYHEKYLPTAIILGFAVLTRADSILAVLVLLVDYIYHHRRIPWNEGIVFIWIILPWFLFSELYFGNLLPNTFGAKISHGMEAQWTSNLWNTFIDGGAGNPFGFGKGYNLLLYTFTLFGVYYVLHQKKIFSPLLFWTILYFISYSLLGVPAKWYWWYFTPLILGMSILAGLGVSQSAKLIITFLYGEEKPYITPDSKIVYWTYLLVSIFFLLVYYPVQWYIIDQKPKPDPRQKLYSEISRWLDETQPKSSAIACWDIGYLGYYSNRKIIDLAGLTSPRIPGPALPQNHWIPLRKEKPEFFIHPFYYEEIPLWVRMDYRPIKSFSDTDYHSGPIIVYQRIDLIKP